MEYSTNPWDRLRRVPRLLVTSDDLVDGATLPLRQISPLAGGGGIAPHLAWEPAAGAIDSYAVTCFDADAPSVSGFWHWIVVNVPSTITELRPAVSGAGTGGELLNDARETGYLGAYPDTGDKPHRYIFTVHALEPLDYPLSPDTPPGLAAILIERATVSRGHLTAYFGRPGEGS